MARSDPQVNIRMPIELKERLEGVLRETGRSLNAEIVTRLQESFDARTTIQINADSYEDAIVLMGRVLLGADAARPWDKKKLDPEMARMIETAVEKADSLAKAKKKSKT